MARHRKFANKIPKAMVPDLMEANKILKEEYCNPCATYKSDFSRIETGRIFLYSQQSIHARHPHIPIYGGNLLVWYLQDYSWNGL